MIEKIEDKVKTKNGLVINIEGAKPPVLSFRPQSKSVYFDETTGEVDSADCGNGFVFHIYTGETKPSVIKEGISFTDLDNLYINPSNYNYMQGHIFDPNADFSVLFSIKSSDFGTIENIISSFQLSSSDALMVCEIYRARIVFGYGQGVGFAESYNRVNENEIITGLCIKKGNTVSIINQGFISKITIDVSGEVATEISMGTRSGSPINTEVHFIDVFDYAILDTDRYSHGEFVGDLNLVDPLALDPSTNILFTNKERGYAYFTGVSVSSMANVVDNQTSTCIGDIKISNRNGFKLTGIASSLLSVPDSTKTEISIEGHFKISTHSTDTNSFEAGIFQSGVLTDGIAVSNTGALIIFKDSNPFSVDSLDLQRWYNLSVVKIVGALRVFVNGHKTYDIFSSSDTTILNAEFGIKSFADSIVNFESLSLSYADLHTDSFIPKLRNQ